MNRNLIFAGALAYVGYEAYRLNQFVKSYSFRISNFSFKLGGATQMILGFDLKINNPTKATIPITRISGDIIVNQTRIGAFHTIKRIDVKPNSATSVPVQAVLSNVQTLVILANMNPKKAFVAIDYGVTVSPKVLGIIPIPLTTHFRDNYDFAPFIAALRERLAILKVDAKKISEIFKGIQWKKKPTMETFDTVKDYSTYA